MKLGFCQTFNYLFRPKAGEILKILAKVVKKITRQIELWNITKLFFDSQDSRPY